MKKKKPRDDFEDDGRTIADMNLEGMPWHVEKKKNIPESERITLTKAEKHAAVRGVLCATLLVAGVFVLCFTVFLLLCVYVWF